ncbi:MAG: Cna B-type domain-containing protein [Clostridiales bacterium]|nr:Cna B-type domain-containing protein [Clostridiales bacterium]
MKHGLHRFLSILCVFALVLGCVCIPAAAEDSENVLRVVTVQWQDEDNYDNIRPGTVDLKLGDVPVSLSAAGSWTAEVAAPADAAWSVPDYEGYTKVTTGTTALAITYTHEVKRTFARATVAWADADNAAGLRPDAVEIRLTADGAPYGTAQKANAANSWTVEWTDLPVTWKGSAEKIAYAIEPANKVEGYNTSVSGGTLTCSLQTGSLTLQASASGAPEGTDLSGLKLTVSGPDPSMPVSLTLGQISGGTYDFGQVLPGAYLVQEENADSLVEGYVMDPAASKVGDAAYVTAGGSATLTFRYTYREPVPAEPNEEPMDSVGALSFEIIGPDFHQTVTYAQFTNGKYELDGLKPGSYTVIERNAETLVETYTLTSDSVTGMSLAVAANGTATAQLFNRYVPAPTPEPDAETVDIPVTKTWNDDNNKDGNRPASITVNLYADGAPVASQTVTAENGWACVFTEMPRFNEDKSEIVYTVNEEAVAWYTPVINGWNIINNYEPEVTSVSVSKVWNDNDNAQKIRPTTLAVTLLPVGRIYVLSADNGWSVTVNNLPTKINGEPVTYSWTEQETVGYVRENVAVDGAVTVFTNRIVRVPNPPPGNGNPRIPGETWVVFEEYDTALGMDTIINHVGDCFD